MAKRFIEEAINNTDGTIIREYLSGVFIPTSLTHILTLNTYLARVGLIRRSSPDYKWTW